VQEILDGVLSNELFHHVFFMGSFLLPSPMKINRSHSPSTLPLSLLGDMNYRITFNPVTPADVISRSESKASGTSAPAAPKAQLKSTNSSVTDGEDIDNLNDDDDDDTDDIDPNDTSREDNVALVYKQITEENW
jgi:hypothetical protein